MVKRLLQATAAAGAISFAAFAYLYLSLPDVRPLRTVNPRTTAFMELRAREADKAGKKPRKVQQWVSYERISPSLKRAVIVAEDAAFFSHEGVDFDETGEVVRGQLEQGQADARREHHHPAAGQEPLPVAVEQPGEEDRGADDRPAARSGVVEAPHPRAVSERHRVGRRHLGSRGRGAGVFPEAGVGPGRRRSRRCWRPRSSTRGGSARRIHRNTCCAGRSSSASAWETSSRRPRPSAPSRAPQEVCREVRPRSQACAGRRPRPDRLCRGRRGRLDHRAHLRHHDHACAVGVRRGRRSTSARGGCRPRRGRPLSRW